MTDLNRLRDQIGEISVAALAKGGEPLLEKVDHALGVALRHSQRVAEGTLQFTPAVAREVEASIARAREVLDRS